MTSRRLYDLDWSSVRFPDQLYQILRDEEHVEHLMNLPEDGLAGVINYLNDDRSLVSSIAGVNHLGSASRCYRRYVAVGPPFLHPTKCTGLFF